MKSTDISFRAKIGSFHPNRIKNRYANSMILYLSSIKYKNVLSASLLLILLLIGNVELNPGPVRNLLICCYKYNDIILTTIIFAQMAYTSVNYKVIDELKKKCNGDNNPVRSDSVWGQLCLSFFEQNDMTSRKFVSGFYNIFSGSDNVKQ